MFGRSHHGFDVLDDAALIAGIGGRNNAPQEITVIVEQPQKDQPVLINAAEGRDFSQDWQDFIGQNKVKAQLRTYIDAAKVEQRALEHVLLASGFPGVGKTTMARLIAKEMGVHMVMLVPPFALSTLQEALVNLPRRGIVFIDEIHKLADLGARGPEMLLHILEEKRIYGADGVIELRDPTIIGATTEADKLPETILTRFEVRPHFERYDEVDMLRIATQMAVDLDLSLSTDTISAIADASHGIPRRVRSMVKAARAMTTANGRPPTGKELLNFQEIDPDGLEAIHRDYLTNMFKFFSRRNHDGRMEYVAGEASMMTLLRETKQGVGRIERFLIEKGLLDRTPSGRRLTPAGITRARTVVNA